MTRRAYRQSLAKLDPSFTTLAASYLAQRGAEKRRERIRETARQMRAELGLPPVEALR